METLTYLSLAVFVLSVILLVGIFLIIKLYDRISDLKDVIKYRETVIESKDSCIDELSNELEAMSLGKVKEPLVIDKDLLTVCDRAGLSLVVRFSNTWSIKLYRGMLMHTIFEAKNLPSLDACTKAAIDYLNNCEE